MIASRLVSGVTGPGLFVATGLWLAALWTTELELGAYGIVPSLSPLWYVAAVLAFGGLVGSVHLGRYAHAAGYAALLAIFITLTPFVLEETVRFPYVFNSHRYADQLLQTEGIDYRETYMAWPGWHIVSAATAGAGEWDPASYLQWGSLVLGALTLGASVMLFRRMTGPGRLFWAALIAALPLLGGLTYPVPAGMAALLWIVLLVLVADEHLAAGRPSVGRRAASLALVVGIAITHMLTTLTAIASLLILLVAARHSGSHARLLPVALFGAVVALAYVFHIASETTSQLLPGHLATILDLDRLFGSTAAATGQAIGSGSQDHVRVVLIRIGYVVVSSLLVLLALVVGLVGARRRDRSFWFPASVTGSGAAVLPTGAYGGEILIRAYSFSAVGMAPLIGRLVNARGGWLLLPVLLAGVVLVPIRAYGNELYDHVRHEELAAHRWVEQHGPKAYALSGVSRTLMAEWIPAVSGPRLTVSGPLYDEVYGFLRSDVEPPELRWWQYDNGAVRLVVEGAGP